MKKQSLSEFEKRKKDHIRLSMQDKVQGKGQSGLESIHLQHEALPEFNFQDIQLKTKILGHTFKVPLLISSMTAGHKAGEKINLILAQKSVEKGWLMAVGSQRRELTDSVAAKEWSEIHKKVSNLKLISNIGIAQAIVSKPEQIESLVQSTQSIGLYIHCNPLQEVLQPQGNTEFKGGLQTIEKLIKTLSVPVLVKEVGCGFSLRTMQRLQDIGVSVIDVAGRGGTHWGRLEGYRSKPESKLYQAGQTFGDWGFTTLESLTNAKKILKTTKVWASGGVRSGLDAAKFLALGADVVGFAQPLMKSVLQDLKTGNSLDQAMEQIEFELRVAMFCSGAQKVSDLKEKINKV